MSSSRMGFDLFTIQGWKNARFVRFGLRRSCRFWSLVWGDTFLQIICKMKGHRPYDADGQMACSRCRKYLGHV